MTIEDAADNLLPELPALVVIPTSGFDRPERHRRNNPTVPEFARTDILLATASLLSLIELVESLFSNRSREEPTRQSLVRLRKSLEELEDAIVGEYFDQHPNIDTSELAAILEEAENLIETLPDRTSSAGQAALRYLAMEIHRRAHELFNISIMSISVLDAENAFAAVDELPYPPH